MKKLLALVLALVMTLGLATIGANAAASKTTFKDDTAIEHKEAATVLNAIGVLKGDENGSFNPTQSLTREQAIKIVIYMIEGEGANNLKAVSAPFTDVAADRWSAGVIAEAKALKIVDGNGDGTFSPEAPLTSSAFGKMLLVALGYEDRYEGFTGSDWMINVARLVNSTGLGDKIASLSFTGPISRDDAAQMAYNCLQADMNEYTGNLMADKNGNLGNQRNVRGITSYWYDGIDDGDMQFCEAYFPNLHLDRVGQDDFGNPLAYWYLGNNRLDNDRTDAKTITEVTTADKVLTYTGAVKVKQIYADLGLGSATNFGSANVNPANFAVPGANNNGMVWVDGKAIAATQANLDGTTGTADATIGAVATYLNDNLATAGKISAGDDAKFGGKGILTTVSYTMNADNPIVITMVTTFLAKAQADYNTKDKEVKLEVLNDTTGVSKTVSGDPAEDDYFEAAVNAKEDDYFWVTADRKAGFEFKSVTPVTNVIKGAAVTAAKANDDVTAAGTKYEYAEAAERTGAVDGTFDALRDGTTGYTMNNGATYDFVLDPYGYVLYAEEADTASNMSDYVVVLAAEVTSLKMEAKLLFSDGSTKTVTVAKVRDNTTSTDYKAKDIEAALTAIAPGTPVSGYTAAAVTAATALQTDRFYKFHENKSGEYELTFVFTGAGTSEQFQVATTAVDGNTAKPIAADASVTANTKSTLLADEKAYVGVKNWVDVAAGSTVVVLRDSKNANIILGAYTTTGGTNSAAASDYFLLFNDVTKKVDSDGDTYYSYEAVKSGELVTLDVTATIGAAYAQGKTTAAQVNDIAFVKVDKYDDGKADQFDGGVLGGALTGVPYTANYGEATDAGFLRCIEYADGTTAAKSVNIKNDTLTINGDSFLLASNAKLFEVDGRAGKDHAPEATSAGVLNNLTYSATRVYYVFGMTDDDGSDTITTLYVVRLG